MSDLHKQVAQIVALAVSDGEYIGRVGPRMTAQAVLDLRSKCRVERTSAIKAAIDAAHVRTMSDNSDIAEDVVARILMELGDRRLLDDVSFDLHQEIAEAVIKAANPLISTDSTGWLIEQNDPPEYHVLNPNDYDEHFTKDARRALRFARREDAQAYADHIGWTSPPVRIVEHMWPSPQPNDDRPASRASD